MVLGFDNIADYVRIPSDFGASIGRYANRIGHGRFVLDGDTVRLPVNNYGTACTAAPTGGSIAFTRHTSPTRGRSP